MWQRLALGKGKHLLVAGALISTTHNTNHTRDAYNGCKQCRSCATGCCSGVDEPVVDALSKSAYEHSAGGLLESSFEEAGCSVGALVCRMLCPEAVVFGELAGLAAAGLAAESANEAIEERIVQPAARRLAATARNTKCEARIAEAACYVFLEGLA